MFAGSVQPLKNRLGGHDFQTFETRVMLAPPTTSAGNTYGTIDQIAGGSLATDNGEGAVRGDADGSTPVAKVAGNVYADNQLNVFKRQATAVKPGSPGQEHVGSNPWRTDGTALGPASIPGDFSGRVPVFTLGNHWQNVGPGEGPPSFSGGLDHDTGLRFENGGPAPDGRPITVAGEAGATVTNETNASYFISAGVFPGSEQPGQAITLSNPGSTVDAPIPPKGWWNFAEPKVYSSVAGLDPVDGIGWHESNAFPAASENFFGPNPNDFGTPGFAYLLTNKYAENDWLFGSLTINEGYDPAIAGDPGYGIALELVEGGESRLIGVQDIQLTGAGAAEHRLWADSTYNPGRTSAGRLVAYPVALPGATLNYRLVTHAEADRLFDAKDPGSVLSNTVRTG